MSEGIWLSMISVMGIIYFIFKYCIKKPPCWQGGFYCPCHSTTFDLAGRVYKNKPAPDNLVVPPYKFAGDNRIVIGEDDKTKGA